MLEHFSYHAFSFFLYHVRAFSLARPRPRSVEGLSYCRIFVIIFFHFFSSEKSVFVARAQHVPDSFRVCSRFVPLLFCSPFVLPLFTVCSPFVLFKKRTDSALLNRPLLGAGGAPFLTSHSDYNDSGQGVNTKSTPYLNLFHKNLFQFFHCFASAPRKLDKRQIRVCVKIVTQLCVGGVKE